jgi:hypothetical protein
MSNNIQELANQYVALCNTIKNDANAVAELRKTLKKLDAVLVVEMAAHDVNEVSAGGVVISRVSRLSAK